jgi:hypothetical protein
MGKTQWDAQVFTATTSGARSIVRESANRLSTKRLSSITARRSSALPVPSDTTILFFLSIFSFTLGCTDRLSR